MTPSGVFETCGSPGRHLRLRSEVTIVRARLGLVFLSSHQGHPSSLEV